MVDAFVPLVSRQSSTKDFTSFVGRIETIVASLYRKYRRRLGYSWEGFDVLVMGLDGLSKGSPRIRHVYQEGYSEEIDTYEVIGHGQDFAMPFVKMLYSPEASVPEMWKGSMYAIGLIERLELDVTVGGNPDVVIAKKGVRPQFFGWGQREYEGAIDGIYNTWRDYSEVILRNIVFNDDFHLLLNEFGLSPWADPNQELSKWAEQVRKDWNEQERKRQLTAKQERYDRIAKRMREVFLSGADAIMKVLAEAEKSSQ
jgi:hypothetical protein